MRNICYTNSGDDMNLILNDYKSFFKEISKNILLYLGIVLFATIVSAAYNVLFGIYMKNAGYTEDVVGSVLSLKTFGIALGAIPIAVFSMRFNKKKTLLLGLLIMFTSSLVILNSTNVLIMKIFSLIFGIGHATVMILQAPIIYENTRDEHRVIAFSMAFVFQNIAFVFGSLVLGNLSDFVASLSSPLQGNLLVLKGSTYLIIIAIFMALKLDDKVKIKDKNTSSLASDIKEVLDKYMYLLSGRTLRYLTQVALVGVGAGMIVPFFSMYLKYTLNTSDGTVGNIMAISQVGTIIGGLIVPPLAKSIGKIKTIILCQLLSIPFLISISFPQGIFIITLSFFFRSSLMNMASPIIGTLAMEIVDEDMRTHMSGMISLINNLFRALGIYIGGYIMFKYSYNTPYYFTILCYLLGTYIIYSVFKNDENANSNKRKKAI